MRARALGATLALYLSAFTRQRQWVDLRAGALFRFDGLPANQIAMKVEAPPADRAVLVLGSVTGGPYPAPWLGPMRDITAAKLYGTDRAHVVHPILLDVAIGKDAVVLPGDLLRSAEARYSIYVGDCAAIDLTTGRRRRARFDTDRVHKAWSIHWADECYARAFFLFPTPGGRQQRP